MNIFIDASNVHQGGGKILLFEFLSSIPENVRLDITVYIDYRLTLTQKLKSAKHIKFKRITFWKRPFVQVIIFFRSSKAKSILFFGNIPPIIPMRAQTFLLQSNRFVIENFTTKGMSFFHRLRINLERFIFYNVIAFRCQITGSASEPPVTSNTYYVYPNDVQTAPV